ncbi:hypothetical protein GGI42DRAFT_337550, partial [Trichoderma sp. SZMC 28013]
TPTIAILAALSSLQVAAAQVIAGKTIWVDAATCDPWAKTNGFPSAAGPGGLFTTAYDFIDKMVIANSYRLYNPSTQLPAKLPANILAWERYRLNSTYGAFFGNNTVTTQNTMGVWDIALMLFEVDSVFGSRTGAPSLFVVCDDASYVSKNSSSGRFVFTDPYYHLSVELPGDDFINDGITTPCATNGQSSYYISNNQKMFQKCYLLYKEHEAAPGLYKQRTCCVC